MKPADCEECGGDGIYHRLTYITVALDDLLRPFFTPNSFLRPITSWMYKVEKDLTPKLLSWFVKRGWAKKVTDWDDETPLLARMLWEEGKARGIDIWEFRLFGLARNIYVAKLKDGTEIAYEGIPLPPAGLTQAWWMDNKGILKKKFRELGIPVSKGAGAFTRKQAREIYKKLSAPVIAKPHSGSASRHTTLHITDVRDLIRGFEIAKEVAPFAVIEEELVGGVYRATVVNGKLAATLRRDQPHVIGDGKSSIRKLMLTANEHPARQGPFFHRMYVTTPAAFRELEWQGHQLSDVPKKGERVILHPKINWSVGGTTTDVTDEVHPDNRELFERIAEVLAAPVVGIDFIIADMNQSWKEQDRCGVIECNSMPFFDNHHLPFEGKPRNVAGDIWEMVLNEP